MPNLGHLVDQTTTTTLATVTAIATETTIARSTATATAAVAKYDNSVPTDLDTADLAEANS